MYVGPATSVGLLRLYVEDPDGVAVLVFVTCSMVSRFLVDVKLSSFFFVRRVIFTDVFLFERRVLPLEADLRPLRQLTLLRPLYFRRGIGHVGRWGEKC